MWRVYVDVDNLADVSLWRESHGVRGTISILGGSEMAKEVSDDFVMQLIGCQDRLRGFLRCLLVANEDLDDVLQNTNYVLLKKSNRFATGTDFWAWSCQVARYEVLSYYRKQSRDRHLFDVDIVKDLASRAEAYFRDQPEQAEVLEVCLDELSEKQVQLIEARYSATQPIQKIAEDLQRPAGSIRQTLYRIREQLRACIESKLSGDVG